jgi:hypothetical protein
MRPLQYRPSPLLRAYLGGRLEDDALSDDALATALAGVPQV